MYPFFLFFSLFLFCQERKKMASRKPSKKSLRAQKTLAALDALALSGRDTERE